MAGKKSIVNKYGLNAYQEQFCHQYVINQFNGRQSVIDLKPALARKSAGVEASKLLTNPIIVARVEMILAAKMKEMHIEAADVVQELARGATFNIEDFAIWDGEGNVTIRPSSEISRESKSAVKSIKQTVTTISQKDGSDITRSRMELTFISKEKCLELLGRYFAMYVDKREIRTTSDLVERMKEADEKLEEIRGKGSIELLNDNSADGP
ncbi:MAG: terminase small subunit [Bacteroidales bacterium]|nr:terminase small subunit [Candidatus Latescibacterota bacterium]